MQNEHVDGLSTDKILLAAKNMLSQKHKIFPATHLDIGSGEGSLISLLRANYEIKSIGCDYTSSLMRLGDVEVKIANLNNEKLPFSNGEFDIVTCTEVIEHLEHYIETIQEAYRVLRTNGTFVLTTPNILNLKSRIRFLFFGFYNLFGPIPFRKNYIESTDGHITPIGLFYLVHALQDAGFSDISIAIDKKQGTSKFWLLFLYLPIKFFSFLMARTEMKKYQTIDEKNFKFVDIMNSVDILTGRTLVVGCKKILND